MAKFLFAVFAFPVVLLAGAGFAFGQVRWEPAIQAFEEADQQDPPPDDPVLFVGSSSIRMWRTLEEDFEGLPVMNRGFGGSQMSDLIHYAHRIVTPYAPRLILVYEGDNDVAAGKSAEQVYRDYRHFASLTRNLLPQVRIAFISIKPSLAREHLLEEMRRANDLIEEYAEGRPHLEFIDVFMPMLGEDGQPRPDIFIEDGLHMNEKGYAIWKDVIAPYLHQAP